MVPELSHRGAMIMWEFLPGKGRVIEFRSGTGESHQVLRQLRTLQPCLPWIEACKERKLEKHCPRCSFESRGEKDPGKTA